MFRVRNWVGVISTPIIVTSVGCAVTHQPVANNQRGLTTDRMMTIGKTLERQGHLEQARFAYQQVLAVQPQNSNAQQSLETLIALETQQYQLKYGQQYVPAGNIMVPQQQMMAMTQMAPQQMMQQQMVPQQMVSQQMAPTAGMPMNSMPMTSAPMTTAQTSNSSVLAPLAQIPSQSMTMRQIPMTPHQPQMTSMQQMYSAAQPQMTMVQTPMGTMQAPMTMTQAQMVQTPMTMMPAQGTTVQTTSIMMPPVLPHAPLPTHLSSAPATNMVRQVGISSEVARPNVNPQQPATLPIPAPSMMSPMVPAAQTMPTQQRVSQIRMTSRMIAVASPAIVVPQLSVTPVSLPSSKTVAVESFEPVELPSPAPLVVPVESLPVPEPIINAAIEPKAIEVEPAAEAIQTVANEVIAVPSNDPVAQSCDVEFQLPIVTSAEDPYSHVSRFDPIVERHEEVTLDLNQISDLSLHRFFNEFSTEVIEELKANRDECVNPLCRLAADSTKQRELRTRAVLLLGAMGPDAASAIPDLRRSMHHTRDRYLQADFAEAILKIQGSDPDAVEVLVDCLQHSDRGLKLIAAFSLRNAAPSEIPRAIDGLERWIGTDDLKLKRMIYLTLGEFGPAAARTIPYLEAGLQNPDQSTREIAAASLASVAPERSRLHRAGSAPDLF